MSSPLAALAALVVAAVAYLVVAVRQLARLDAVETAGTARSGGGRR
jgi:hypothetical protein